MSDDPNLREQAYRGLRRKRDFVRDVVAYIVVNILLIAVWYFASGHHYFWPGWVMVGWGALLALHAWNVYGHNRRPITEAEITRETERMRRPEEPPEDHADAA